MLEQDANAITAIIQVINLYGVAMDTKRWELFDRIFTSDVEADFAASGHWQDLQSFKADFARFHAPFDSMQHAMSNHLVNVDGDAAQAFSYGSWHLMRRGMEDWQGKGWYDDDLVRSPEGRWLIRRRKTRILWSSDLSGGKDALPDEEFDLRAKVLRKEADAAAVSYINAICP